MRQAKWATLLEFPPELGQHEVFHHRPMGLDYHYYSLSRGVLDTRDLVYFISFSGLFIWITKLVYESRKW